VKDWSRFQHYKRRSPPWIKLHRSLLDNREYQQLEDAAARLLFDIWLIASENDGCLPFDSAALAWRLRKSVQVVRDSIQALIRARFISSEGHDASSALALGLHDATPETEAERETEAEESKALVALRATPTPPVEVHHQNGNGRKPVRSVDAIIAHLQEVSTQTDRRLNTEAIRDVQVQVVFAYWAKRLGHEKTLLDQKRQRVLERRLSENGGNLSELLYAIDGALKDDWTMGRDVKSPRKYDGIETVFRDRAQVERFAGECPDWRAGKPHPMATKYAGAEP
jgi:hypothetical protein